VGTVALSTMLVLALYLLLFGSSHTGPTLTVCVFSAFYFFLVRDVT
jgi:hypothetical protein